MPTILSFRRMSEFPALPMNGSYELYDGRTLQDRVSIEDDLLSPPGGPACHPPGSSKQMKDIEKLKTELRKKHQENEYKQRIIDNLQKRIQSNKLLESHLINENGNKESSVEDEKGLLIRHLQRQVTILQAEIYKKDGLEKKMIELRKEKSLVDDRLRNMARQLEAIKAEALNTKEQLQHQIKEKDTIIGHKSQEIEKLTKEKKIDKGRVSALMKENCDTNSPPSSSSPINGTSLASLSCSYSSYSQELDCMHKTVDVLRAKVMEQRYFIINLVNSTQGYTNSVSATHAAALSTPAMAGTTTTAGSIRQAEENSEGSSSPTPSNVVVSSVSSCIHSSAKSTGLPQMNNESINVNTSQGVLALRPAFSSASLGSNPSHHQQQHILAPSGIHQGLGNAGSMIDNPNHGLQVKPSDFSNSNVGSGNSPRSNEHYDEKTCLKGGLTLSKAEEKIFRPAASSEDDITNIYDAAYMLDMPHQNGRTEDVPFDSQRVINGSPKQHALRSSSQSEIIGRNPHFEEKALPTRSRTEILGTNPNIPFQKSVSEDSKVLLPNQYRYKLLFPPENSHPQAHVLGSAGRSGETMGNRGAVPHEHRFVPPHQSSAATTTTTPVLSQIAGSSQAVTSAPVASYSNTLSNISDVSSFTAPHPLTQQQQQQRAPEGGRGQDKSNRLCPMCNHNFSHISMEDFQTHVFDCFDNESGPETLQALSDYEHPPRVEQQGRTCPMCQIKFDISIKQSDFEQHVHQHFGEERFEVIG